MDTIALGEDQILAAFGRMREFLGLHKIVHFNVCGYMDKMDLLVKAMPALAFTSALILYDDRLFTGSEQPRISSGRNRT